MTGRLASLFSFAGRAPRKTYWLTILPLSLVVLTAVGLSLEPAFATSAAMQLGALALMLAAVVPMLAVTVRRLHDRGKSAWWLVLYWLLPALFAPSFGEPAIVPIPNATLAGVAQLLSVGISIWSIIDLGFLKGEPRFNRHGPDPFGRGAADVFA